MVSVVVMGVSSCFYERFGRGRLPEAAEPLQHLDLVAVRILDEEETGDRLPILVELHDLARLEALGLETPVLRV
jgi:hypothetical protein